MKLLKWGFGCCVCLKLLACSNVKLSEGVMLKIAPSLNGLFRIDKDEYFAQNKCSVAVMLFEELTAEHLTLLLKSTGPLRVAGMQLAMRAAIRPPPNTISISM